MSHSPSAKLWLPARFTIGKFCSPDGVNPFVVVISNQPLEKKSLLLGLCHTSLLVVCADGGANRMKDLNLRELEEENCSLNMICGDMDSVRPEVVDYYKQKGVKIIKDTDQYSTDLMKCLKYIGDSEDFDEAKKTHFSAYSLSHDRPVDVALFGGLGGRADQAFSQLHHLYEIANRGSYPWTRDIYLITKESIVFLLEKGLNRIHTHVQSTHFTENVGIIPIGRPSTITTRGLEWNVTDWPTEFGGQMSTSNHIKAEFVEVETTERVLFTLEYGQEI